MRFFVLTLLVLAAFLIFFDGISFSNKNLVSPLSSESKQSFLQQMRDKKIFEENKDKVKGEVVEWANGTGGLHPTVNTPSYIVVDQDGKVVFAKEPDLSRSPASLTKIMTAMVVLDFASPDEILEVSEESVNLEPTILMVDEGEKISVGELLEAALITSANDAADVLAYGIAKKLGGSKEVVIKLMNEKAKKLGLMNTQFKNSMGYDAEGQYSTARELSKVAYYAMENYPLIKEIVATRSSNIPRTADHKPYELPNWNALLGVYEGVDGVKIGNTGEAGHTTIVTSTREGKRFMVVLLGAPDRQARDMWAAELLNSAFLEYGIKPFRVTWPMVKVRYTEWAQQLQKAQLEAENYNKYKSL